MIPWLPNLYRRDGTRAGAESETLTRRALAQAQAVQAKGLPAILTLRHLASEAGVDYPFLRKVVTRSAEDDYRVFQISKRSGGKRTICVPEPRLRAVQQWLVANVLSRLTPHAAAAAYHPGTSILRAAAVHCGCRWLIKMDVEKFFESISERQVYHVFRSAGYQALVAFELTRICTRIFRSGGIRYQQRRWSCHSHRYETIRTYARSEIGHLPQGAPTSPMLSNLAVKSLDGTVMRISQREGLAYSRYADDLVLSTSDPDFDRAAAGRVIDDIYAAMRRFGLRPNITKTSVAPPGARKLALGLLVDGDMPRLSRAFRDRIDVHLHGLRAFGAVGHARHRGMSVFGLRRHLYGLAEFARSVQRDLGDSILAELAAVDWVVA